MSCPHCGCECDPGVPLRVAALALDKPTRTVRRWCVEGTIAAAFRVGRRWRIRRAFFAGPVLGAELERAESIVAGTAGFAATALERDRTQRG
jgi:hypothetical protein